MNIGKNLNYFKVFNDYLIGVLIKIRTPFFYLFMKTNPEYLLSKAQKKIQLAEEELMKPNEDVVSFSICNQSKSAIKILLESYLIKHNINFNDQEPLALLLERCTIHNPNFKSIDLSSFNCRNTSNSQNYCDDINKVSNCLSIAKQIEALIAN